MTGRTFPIMRTAPEIRDRKSVFRASIPFEMIAPREVWAQRNHHQSVERLAERGGLTPCEAVAVLEGRLWALMSAPDARARLEELVQAWEHEHPDP